MKKYVTIVSLAVCAALAYASDVAQSVYKSGHSFIETIMNTRSAHAKWLEENAKPNPDVKYGDWFISQGIEAWRKKAVKAANPAITPFSEKAILVRRPLWSKVDVKDAVVFDLHKFNFRLVNNATVFLTCEINASRDCKTNITVAFENLGIVYLNGKSLGELKKGEGKVFSLDLKKGSNRLVIETHSFSRVNRDTFFFAPYADPVAVSAAKELEKNYKRHFNVIDGAKRSPVRDDLLPFALIAAKDNRLALDEAISQMIEVSLFSAGKFERDFVKIKNVKSSKADEKRIKLLAQCIETLWAETRLGYDVKNVRAAMEDIKKSYPDYDKDGKLFAELKKWEGEYADIRKSLIENSDTSAGAKADEFRKFARSALLANPLLKKYPKWVYIKRDKDSKRWGLPQNWQGNSTLACEGTWVSNSKRDKKVVDTYKDELWTFDITNPDEQKLLFKPAKNNMIADLDISYDGEKILYSTLDDKLHFQLAELNTNSGATRQLSSSKNPDIDNYDGVYLPDGNIIYCSTACWVGVPCVGGNDYVANIYTFNPNAGDEDAVEKSIRQLTFEQDADWMPVVLENGRIMYTRWEYVDNSHYFSRILMHMNPDGTAQSSLYGSTSYWPNSLFYARQIPGDPNKFVGIVSGHHGIARTGELHLFDISKGTIEESGRVHKYPSYGREYVAETKDELVRGKWPQIIHPYPLSENYIVASVRNPSARQWLHGVCLIDKFDNITPLTKKIDNGQFLTLEPMPLQAREKPTEIADKTNPELDYGYVFLNDIYQGDGLKDVPRGTVKSLRILEYHYAYRDMGSHNIIGNEGSWDVKRIHGTVPVLEDGSALFKVPANRPLALQPLDKDGKALALMRTWFTVMPGETQSCVGCHEGQGMSPTSKPALAARKRPSTIKPFVAGVRGYSFERDVQPVLDKYCAGCHDGSNEKLPNFKRGVKGFSNFPKAYLDLAKYVRRSGPECYQNLLTPLEFNVDTSELMQLIRKGHKGVKLDEQSMKILITWIDFNVPCFGSWYDIRKDIPHNGDKMRMKYLAKYANRHDDQNKITYDGGVQEFVAPAAPKKHKIEMLKADGFPFDSKQAEKMQTSSELPKELEADVDGEKIRFVLVPAGSYVMGNNRGFFDEGPAKIERVEKPFYMSQFEVSNAQYAKFDAKHNSGYHDRQYKDHVNRGYIAHNPKQPVIRVNWNQANSYCDWLSKKLGVKVGLPTEKQWEWAARAGTSGDFWFGGVNSNYGASENLADYTIKNFAVVGVDPQPVLDGTPLNTYTPFDDFADDGQLVGCDVGMYKPNAFGLYDMLGNVSEWTADDYTETLGGKKVEDKKAVRGGSWRDRAKRSRVTMRRDYYAWQKVYNVGVRLVIDDVKAAAKHLKKAASLPAYVERDITPCVDNIPHN